MQAYIKVNSLVPSVYYYGMFYYSGARFLFACLAFTSYDDAWIFGLSELGLSFILCYQLLKLTALFKHFSEWLSGWFPYFRLPTAQHVGSELAGLVLSQAMATLLSIVLVSLQSEVQALSLLFLCMSLLRGVLLSVFVQCIYRRATGASVVGGALQMIGTEPLYLVSVFTFGTMQALMILFLTREGSYIATQLGRALREVATQGPDLL